HPAQLPQRRVDRRRQRGAVVRAAPAPPAADGGLARHARRVGRLHPPAARLPRRQHGAGEVTGRHRPRCSFWLTRKAIRSTNSSALNRFSSPSGMVLNGSARSSSTALRSTVCFLPVLSARVSDDSVCATLTPLSCRPDFRIRVTVW